MAATYGRHTGKAGVCLATLGPGATNLVTAAAYAQLGGMPMLMITGQKPIKKSKQGRFQILDVVGMMRPITKYHPSARQSATIFPRRVREAFRLAEEEKPGATHLEFPEDIADEETDSRPIPASLVRRPSAEAKAVRAAVRKHRASRIAVAGDRRRRQSQHDRPSAAPVRGEDRYSVPHHPAGQGRDRRDAIRNFWAAPRCPPATSSTARSPPPT